MMIGDILSEFHIEDYAFIGADMLKPANLRLYNSLPKSQLQTVFMVIPYYCQKESRSISAYGAVYDYHVFAKKVFEKLTDYFKSTYPDAAFLPYADHSPFLECDGAAKAGLGIIGRNSLLITEKYSSFVFIASFSTDLSENILLQEEKIKKGSGTVSFCESCGRCKEACPTSAGGDTALRSEICLSHITQKKGVLTKDEEELIGKSGSVWGCDVCQDVCPYTCRAIQNGTIYTPIEFFKSSYIGADPLRIIPEMDDATFDLYPFAWRRRGTIERNINIINQYKRNDTND